MFIKTMFVNVRDTHVMKSWELGLFLPLVKCFLFAPSHVWSTSCHKSLPNTLPIRGRHVRKPSLCDMPLCKNLCHMCLMSNMCKATICHLCYIPRLHQFCKNLCHLCYIPRLRQFCKNLCHLCYIPSLRQFCKNLCHLCYNIPCYVNFAKTYVIRVISQAMSILQKPMSFVLYPKRCQFLQKPMSLVLYPKLCQFCKYLCHLCYIARLSQFCKYLCHLYCQTTSILQNLMLI